MGKISLKSTGFLFFGLVIIVFLLQYFILKPHLRYGFADVDWSFLVSFKEYTLMFKNPLEHFLYAWGHWGVYTYQVYYIGLIEKFFGMDYKNFQIVTHIFKFISTLCIFPVILLTTKSRIAAFITTIIYAIAYPAIGAMYTVVTSGLYIAIPFMCLFLIWYWRLINKGKNAFWEVIVAIVLFFVTLLLATERMYPLLPTIILIEFFCWYKNNFSKKVLLPLIKRLSAFAAVFLVMFVLNRADYAGFFGGNTTDTYNRFIWGNWQVLMSPLISFGSLFLPRDYWKILGTPTIDSISSFTFFIISGPIFIFTFVTAFLSVFFSQSKRKFILVTMVLSSVFSLIIYFLSSHQLYITHPSKMHFDVNTVIPALLGGFVISFTIALFKEWLDTGKKDQLSISMIGGIVISLLFIVLTWMAADYILIFTGVHRYLTVPAIGSSLFIAGILTKMYLKLRNSGAGSKIAPVVFLLLIPIISFNAKVIGDYFNYELNYAGTDAEGHIRMKNKLWSFLGDLNKEKPSIFYFDESADHDNGYFDETTVMAGFNFWMRFRGRDIVGANLIPGLLRSNLICPEPRSMCLSKVKSLVTTQDGEKGLLYGGIFYNVSDFYAFRFINKDIVEIKPEVLNAIGLD